MSELIYKQDAIEAIYATFSKSLARQKAIEAVESCKAVKVVEPERKTGRWQITDAYPHNVYCSECHAKFAQTHWAVWEDGSLPRNFCPNCGSYNGGE